MSKGLKIREIYERLGDDESKFIFRHDGRVPGYFQDYKLLQQYQKEDTEFTCTVF